MKIFLYGLSAAFFALIIEIAILAATGKNNLTQDFFSQLSLLLVGFVLLEETLKYFFLQKYFLQIGKKKNPQDFFGLSQIAFFAFGFSSVEVFLNYLSAPFWSISSELMILGLFCVHFFTSFFVGKRFIERKERNTVFLLSTISFAFFLHLLYNIAIIELVK